MSGFSAADASRMDIAGITPSQNRKAAQDHFPPEIRIRNDRRLCRVYRPFHYVHLSGTIQCLIALIVRTGVDQKIKLSSGEARAVEPAAWPGVHCKAGRLAGEPE